MSDFQNEYTTSIAHQAADDDLAQFREMYGEPQEAPAQQEAPKEEAPKQDAPKEVGDEMFTEENDENFISDVGSFLTELPMQLVGGVGDAVNNTVDAARSAGLALGIPNYALQFTDQDGNIDLKFLSNGEVEAAGGLKPGILPKVGEADTAAGGMVRALTTFATGFIPATKAIKAAGLIAKAGTAGKVGASMAAGGIADAIVADPHQARLATLLNEVPALGSIIPDYMADNDPENEAEWEGRIKNVIEGAVLGGMSEVAIRGAVKLFKGYKVASKAPKAVQTPEDALKQIDEVDEAMAAAKEEIVQPAKVDLGPDELLGKAKGKTFLNTKRINTEADVKKVMQKVADSEYETLSKGGKTHEGIKIASEKEMKNVNDLLGRPTTRPFTAEEAVASRNILTASAENLTDLAKLANGVEATPAAMYEFRKALAVHNDIQAKVFGGRKATAQALNSWRITSKSDAARGKAISDLLEQGGGVVNVEKMAKSIADVANNGGDVSKMAAELTNGRWNDAHYQVWINGLLSSPSTHMVNAMSNMGTTIMSIPERYITVGFEKMMGVNGSAFIEANARAAGFFGGISDGFKLMSGKTENIRLTSSSKLERPVSAISSQAWGKQPDSVIGMGLDYLGKAINLPGWALEKGDNFFKGINYRMMLQEKASKTAFGEGLKGKAFSTRVADLVQNPTEAMQEVGTDFAQYQTFTQAGGDVAQAAKKVIGSVPGGRYVVPFVRTPANILKYGFERTPLAPMMSHVRSEIAEGGSKAATAYARMAGGSTLMAGVSAATMAGSVTGSGPSNWKERQALERTGWQPYSVKIGDKYVSYERLEPIGSLIAYSADVTSILGQVGEEEGDSLVAASLAAFSKNLTNKTFLSGMTKFIDVVNSGSEKKWSKYASQMGAGLIAPVASSAVKKTNAYFDDVKRDYTPDDTNGFLKSTFMRAAENIPGMGTSAPPLRDVWGEVQHYSNGIASPIDVMSPIKISEKDDDEVNNMIADNQIIIQMPSRIVKGVQLTNKEYDEYTKLAGESARAEMVDAMNSGVFDRASGGPEGEKALIVHHIMSASKKYACSEMMFNSPDLEDRMYEVKLDKQQKLIGGK